MTKTKTKVRIAISAFCILLFAFCVLISDATVLRADATSATQPATETTDVYWYVHAGKLLLSSEQGSSGYYKWSKDSIAAVNNASGVPWSSRSSEINEIIIYSRIVPPSTAFWFQNTNITSFSASGEGSLLLDMSLVTDASRMFFGCASLEQIDLSGVSAPRVKNIESVFDGCVKIKSLDVSAFNGAPIENMMNAFYDCKALKSLDVSGFDISRVTDFTGVFYNCAELETLDLSALDGSKITNLTDSFNGCAKLTALTFGDRFTCEGLTDMENTFKACKSLTSLDISGFSTSSVKNMANTFSSCTVLESLTLPTDFVGASVTNMNRTFVACNALKSIDTSGWNAVGVKDMGYLFASCTALESIDLSGFDGAKPTDITFMFSNASSLKTVDMSGIDTSQITSLYSLFYGCTSLTGFDLSKIDTSAVTDMGRIFYNCSSLDSYSFAGVNTSNVQSMASMFCGCSALTSVDFTGIDSGKITDIHGMFYGCSSLKRLDLSDFDVTEGLDSDDFIRNCSKLVMITAPKAIPESVSIPLSFFTFYAEEDGEITELKNANQGDTVVRKFTISYSWKNGTQTKSYTLEPSYYYYGYGAKIDAVVSENGYTFEGWTRNYQGVDVTEITETDTGDFSLHAKLKAFQPVAPVISGSGDAIVTYGDGFDVKVSFTEDEDHTYWIEWYRTTWRPSSGGVQVPDLRNTRGFTVDPKNFVHGIKIEEEVYFYCTVKATRKDNGLSKTATSPSMKVYVERAQAQITVHPTAIEGLIYDGTAKAVSTLGESDFGKVSYSFSEFTDYTQQNKQINAGVGILYYHVADGIYYKGTEIYSLEYKIEAATPTLLWETESAELDYSGEAAVLTPPSVILLGSDIYDGEFSYSYSGTESGTGLPVNAGTYTVVASIAEGGNYKAASTEGMTLVINKTASQTLSLPQGIDTLIYNGSSQTLVTDGEIIGGAAEFSLDGTVWSEELPKGKNAGEYTVYYRIKGDKNHLDGESGSIIVSIERKSVTVTADDKTVCESSPYTLSYTVLGLADGDELTAEVILEAEANLAVVGEYVITARGEEESGNYIISYQNGKMTVQNHSYNGEVTILPTCSSVGEITYTCLHDPSHTYTEEIEIDENAHFFGEGEITKAPTCFAAGEKTFICAHDKTHIRTEQIAKTEHTEETLVGKAATCTENGLTDGKKCSVCSEILIPQTEIKATGHEYENGCDADCGRCGETRTPDGHTDNDENLICDECGASLPSEGLSAGAIVGIAVGSTAAVGLGGFSLFWFVIKKKSLAELLAIFKR